MGLLDFLSTKQPAANQSQGGLVVSPATPQNYASQATPVPTPNPAPTKSYTDVQYPIPTNNSQLGSVVLPEANGLTAKTNSYTTESLPQFSKPIQPAPETHQETILDNGIRQVTHSADSSSSFAATQPIVNTPEPIPAVSSQTEAQPLYSYSNNPVPADVLAAQEEQQVPDITEVPVEQTDVTSSEVSTDTQPIEPPVPVEPPVENNVLPPLDQSAANVAPQVEIEKPLETQTTENSSASIIEMGNPIPAQEVKAEEVAPAPAVEITTPEVPTLNSAEPIIAPVAEVEVKTEPGVVENMPVANTNDEPKLETPVIETKPLENKTESEKVSLNILNKIAFVSLNTQSVNSSLSKKVKSLAEMLKSMDVETFIDSNKGYGMDVISGLSGTQNKVTAVYLKPFFSKYSDEATLDVPLTNLTKVNFSTVLDRIKYLYKEATVFIVPETTGLNNLVQAVALLNSQVMYFGSHKPVILFGTAWKDKINSLKNSFGLSQQEVDSMYYASTPEEVIDTLKKLDKEYSEKKVNTNNSVDMRDEQSEKEGLLAA